MIQPCRLASTERGRVNVERCKWEVCVCVLVVHYANIIEIQSDIYTHTHPPFICTFAFFSAKMFGARAIFIGGYFSAHWFIFREWFLKKCVCINQIGAECFRWCLRFYMLCCAVRCRSSGPYMLMNIRAENRNWNMHWIGIAQIQQSLNNTKDRFTNSSCLYAHN